MPSQARSLAATDNHYEPHCERTGQFVFFPGTNDRQLRFESLVKQLVASRIAPESITTDNGSEFPGQAMDAWAHQSGVKLDFIPPGRPVESGYIESFIGRLRDECLNGEVFFSLADALEKLERWRQVYNWERPQSALADRTPDEFARRLEGRCWLRGSMEAL